MNGSATRMPRLMWWIIVVGVIAGVVAAVTSIRTFGVSTSASTKAAERNTALLLEAARERDCIIGVLEIALVEHRQLTLDQLHQFCPPVPVLNKLREEPTATTTTGPPATVPGVSRSLTTLRPRAAGHSPSAPPAPPSTNPASTTTRPVRSTTTTAPCTTLPLIGRCRP